MPFQAIQTTQVIHPVSSATNGVLKPKSGGKFRPAVGCIMSIVYTNHSNVEFHSNHKRSHIRLYASITLRLVRYNSFSCTTRV